MSKHTIAAEPGVDARPAVLLKEAERIADFLMERADCGEYGICWKTPSPAPGGRMEWKASEGIYSGNAGIALFLLELYEQTGNTAYLATASDAIQGTVEYCSNTPSGNHTFLTGRLGVSYALIRFAEVTHDRYHLVQALDIAKSSIGFVGTSPLDEYLSGRSGSLMCLLHLYNASREEWLLKLIDKYAERLIAGAHTAKQGLYWDRSHQRISGLCGLAHGASGVGLVFLELGRMFDNPSFYWLAEQAFLYERQHYSPDKKSWADLRKAAFSETDIRRHKERLREGDISYFTQPSYMNAWCHGAPGIGLVRLRAFELLGTTELLDECFSGVEACVDSLKQRATAKSDTLCHGTAGDAELLLEASLRLGRPEYHEIVLEAAQDLAEQKAWKNGNADPGLFLGAAGLGYFFLRALSPRKVPSLLLPSVRRGIPFSRAVPSHCGTLACSREELRQILLRKNYPRTFSFPEASAVAHEQGAEGLDSAFAEALRDLPREALKQVLRVEELKISMDREVESHALTYVQELAAQESARDYMTGHSRIPEEVNLRLSPAVELVLADFDWKTNTTTRQPIHALVLRKSAYGTIENLVPLLAARILEKFGREGSSPGQVSRQILAMYNLPDEEQGIQFGAIVYEHIRNAFLAGILVLSGEIVDKSIDLQQKNR
jgi:hypothetical protein